VLETVVGQTLVGVMRWAWHHPHPQHSLDPRLGAVHLTFSEGRGLSVDTNSDFTLWWLETSDTTALDRTHDYVMPDGGQWHSRDASSEAPFPALMGSRLLAGRPVFNQVNEVSGLTLTFESGAVTLRSSEHGEVAVIKG